MEIKFYFPMVCFLAGFSAVELAEIEGANSPDVEKALVEIFGKQQKSEIPFEEVRDKLKFINSSENKLSPEEKKKVAELLRVLDYGPSLCDLDHFEDFDKLHVYHFAHQKTIIPYVKKAKQLKFEACRAEMIERLNKFVTGMDEKERERVEKFFDKTVANGDPAELLINGLSELVEMHPRFSKKILKDRKDFLSVFTEAIEPYCRSTKNGVIYDLQKSYDRIFDEGDVDEMVSNFIKEMKNEPLTLSWISYSRICGQINLYLDLYSEETRETLKTRKSITGKTNKFFNKFKGKKI